MLRRWFDGRVKLYVTWKALEARARHAETFRRGSYGAIRGASPNVVAFTRGEDILVATPRLTAAVVKPGTAPVGTVWGDASLAVDMRGSFRNAFTNDVLELDGNIALSQLFARFPVAILERI
jgi:(1->4)-alpha-D-glucan 1-alpha-D-glucosylmutase